MLNAILSAQTTGWISVGFDPTVKMQDANFIIGYVKDRKIYVRDDYGTAPGGHQSDIKIGGKNNVMQQSGYEENGITEISFTIPLNSGDPRDKKLTPRQRYKIIFAFGTADSFSKVHTIEAEATGFINL